MPFPFDLGAATAFYETLIVLTWSVHLFLVHFVLGGTTWLVLLGVLHGATPDPIEYALRDWLPFALGLAITFGVAPLLFLQIVDKESFYTANLLGSHRFMAMLPALIVGFYLLYVLKNWRFAVHNRLGRVALPLLALATFAFTGTSWTENHLLAQQGQETWSELYRSGAMRGADAEVLPRFAFFYACSWTSLALLLSHFVECTPATTRRIARAATVGIVLVAAAALWLGSTMSDARLAPWLSGSGVAWLAIFGVALLVTLAYWSVSLLRRRLAPRFIAWAAWSIAIVAIAALRECLKLASIDLPTKVDSHEDAIAIGGFGAFVAFAVLNAGIVTFALLRVRRELRVGASVPQSDGATQR